MELIIKILVNAAAFYIGAKLLRGVEIDDFIRAIFVAVVVAVLNATLGKILVVLSLGLLSVFGLVLTAIIIMVADYFLKLNVPVSENQLMEIDSYFEKRDTKPS